MKIIVFSQGGMYGYEMGVIKRYAPKISRAQFLEGDKIGISRVDHADLIIYYDRSMASKYVDIEFDIEMIIHARYSSNKGIRCILVTQSNPVVQSHLPRTCKIWNISSSYLSEIGEIDEIPYEFRTYKKAKEYELNKTFIHLAWDKFEDRFVK